MHANPTDLNGKFLKTPSIYMHLNTEWDQNHHTSLNTCIHALKTRVTDEIRLVSQFSTSLTTAWSLTLLAQGTTMSIPSPCSRTVCTDSKRKLEHHIMPLPHRSHMHCRAPWAMVAYRFAWMTAEESPQGLAHLEATSCHRE